MYKTIIKIAAISLFAAASAPVLAASSGTSGASGSAGLGIDYGALVAASGSGDPYIATPGSSATGTLGGPVAGLINQFSKNKSK